MIWGCSRRRAAIVPFAVGAYIVAAYWFTASTSFANPAVTIARALTDTFAGIRPADVPVFVLAQVSARRWRQSSFGGWSRRCRSRPAASSLLANLRSRNKRSPMQIAVFSDVHGNLPALEAVLADIARQAPDAVYCLGDLVGYAPFPNEVIERVRAEQIPTIMGNYDDGVGYDRDECGCAYREERERQLGDQSLAWTKAHVTADNKAFLRSLIQRSDSTRTVNGFCSCMAARDG